MRRKTVYSILSLWLAVVALAAVPSEATAGCLSENNSCEQCARDTMKDAILRLDLRGVRDANVQLWDCAIDLYHCVFYAQHHDYKCAL